MEHFGILGLIPPILTITLAFITKDVVISLFVGIVSGALIVARLRPYIHILDGYTLVPLSPSDYVHH